MVLTGHDVQRYIDAGKLKIEPVSREQFKQNGVDLVLEDVEGHPSCFEPSTFYLGSTRETLELPDDLMAFVQLRSTWARSGIMIPPTVVDAGFKGNLTLELVAHQRVLGWCEGEKFFASMPAVPYDQPFIHLIFVRLSGPAEKYVGKYQGQSGITGARHG